MVFEHLALMITLPTPLICLFSLVVRLFCRKWSNETPNKLESCLVWLVILTGCHQRPQRTLGLVRGIRHPFVLLTEPAI